MERKELNKTFIMILNRKNPLVSIAYTEIFKGIKFIFNWLGYHTIIFTR